MKIYLSGPMRGIPGDNYPSFHKYASKLRGQGHHVYNPAEEEPGLTRRQYFYKDTAWICQEADAIAMMPAWELSLGAKAEWALALALNLKFIYL